MNHQYPDNSAFAKSQETDKETERQAALAYLQTVCIDWGGKPIESREALYDDARG